MNKILILGFALAMILVSSAFSGALARADNSHGCQVFSAFTFHQGPCVSSCTPANMVPATSHTPAHHAWIDK